MSREIICPHCGTSVHVDESAVIASESPASEGPPGDPSACPHPPPGEQSSDDPSIASESATPPSSQAEATEPSSSPESEVEAEAETETPILPPGEADSAAVGLDWLRSSGSGEAIPEPEETGASAPESEAAVAQDEPETAQAEPAAVDPFLEAFAHNVPAPEADTPRQDVAVVPGLDVSDPVSVPPESNGHSRSKSEELPALEVEEEAGRSSLAMVLLSSYASAITLALIWMIWRAEPTKAPVAPTLAASSRTDLEDGGDRAFVASLPPIPAVHTTTIGHPLRVGDLEITPLAVKLGPVRLVSATNPNQHRVGGNGALQLQLRFRNMSDSKEFTPLEPSSVREPDRGVPKTLIVADDHLILPYRLATHSEWEISDQLFLKLAPGAEFETVIVSEDSAREKLASSMTWRLHVQTSLDQAELIGIQFKSNELD